MNQGLFKPKPEPVRGSMRNKSLTVPGVGLVVGLCMIGQVRAQDTLQLVRSYQVLGPENVSALSGLGNNARYGGDVCRIGDLNNDGVTDLLVGHGSHPNGSGAAWIHFMAANGTVQSTVLLSSGANGMPNLNAGDNFGARVADLGDLDLDGVEDIAVLAPGDDAGGTNKGAVHICFLNTNGTIKSKVKITAGLNGFTGSFINGRCFDADVAEVGDMNQDGITDLAVGSSIGDDGGTDRGGVWILLLNTNGTVKGNRYYASNSTSFPWPGGTPLANSDLFGFSVCKVGDLNADGIADLAVAARFKFNVTGQGRGRIFLMYLNANGTIASYKTIGPGFGGFPQVINGTGGHFGWSIDNAGDLNGEGTNGAGADLAEPHQYAYDPIGQLTKEEWPIGGPNVNIITWTPYGKVSQVALHDGTYLRFAYDAAGHRILKAHVTNLNSGLTVAPAPVDEFTYYIHDAQGNLLTTYRRSCTASGPGEITDETRVNEQPLYGSARLGLRTPDDLLVRKLIWDGNNSREVPIPRVAKAELERLDIPSRFAKLPNGIAATPNSNFMYTRTHATSPSNASIAGIVPQHIQSGTHCTNVHRAEDRYGNTLFTATTTLWTVGGSPQHTLCLRDRNGYLMWNSSGIKSASGTVTHSCQVPGIPTQYYLFTVGTDGKPYVHLIDLSVTAITQGAVLIKNILLDNAAGANYNRAMAVVDDRTAYGKSMLYMARRIGGQYTLMGLDIEALTQNGSGQLQAMAPAIGGSSLGQHGLLQISPDGRELAMVSGSGSPMGMFMWATANIHRYNLSADHTQATFLSTYSEANAAFRYMDYSPGGQYLYFVKSGITLGGATHQVKRQNLTTTAVNTVVNNFGGDIRRTKHGEMLVATPAFLYPDEAFRIQLPNTASPSIVWGSFTHNDAKAEGALGLQPLVYELLPAISTRSLNQKRYELTDHLGNVRAVVSDRKLCDNSALPTPPVAYRAEVLNQTDYYPFGMISRSTVANGEEYRFGFQGQEKDDEVYGAPGTSLAFEYRMNDPRIGRFLSIDPLVKNYPDISPYAYVANSPIVYVDIDGRELFIFGSVAYFNRLNAIVKKSFDGYFELIRDESNRVMMVSTKKCRTMQNPISGIERMDALSKTAQYKYLNQVINDSKITKMEVTADDPGTFGGAFRGRRNGSFGDDFNGDRQRIDVSDFEDVVSFKYMSGMALFIHELVEAYLDQTQGHIPVKTQAEFENIFPLYHGPALEAQASVDNIVQSINQSDPANPGVVENYALTKQGAWYKTQITFSGSNAKLIIGQTEEVKDVVLSPDQQRVKSSSPTGIIVPNTK